MPMLRSWGLSWSTRRSPNQISPASGAPKPAMSRSSVVLPQPEGPSSVKSSPSAISSVTRSTAVTRSKPFVTLRSEMFIGPGSARPAHPESTILAAARAAARLRLLPDRFDLRAEPRLEGVGALLGDALVVDVGDLAVEVGAHAARELDGHLRVGAGRSLDLVPGRDREEPALREDLLPALGEQELDEGARRLGVARSGKDGHRLGRHEGVLRRHELDVETRELLLERHVRRDGEAGAVLAFGHDRRHVPAPRGEVAGVRGELLEPLPALLLPVHGQNHLVRRVRRRRARGRALGDLALELRVQQVVPLLWRLDAEPLDLLRVVDEPVRLERGADPEPLRVLQGDGPGRADRRRDRVPHLLGDLHLLQKLLLGELLEQRRLAAPEDVHLGPALPLDDAPVGHGRSRRDRAHLHRDVPLLLRVVCERLERRVVDELRHRSDQRQLTLDGRLGRRAHDRTEHQDHRKRQESESSHGSSPHWGRSPAQSRARSTARRQPSQRAARVAVSIVGVNVRSIVQRRLRSSSDRHRPAPSPARYAAPSAVVSITLGRSTATFMMSAWNWQRKSFAAAPPSTRSSLTPIPASAAIASSTSRLWKAIASSAARARCAPVVPRVSPTIVPRAYMSQYGAPSQTKAGTK